MSGFKFNFSTNGRGLHPAFAKHGLRLGGAIKARGERSPEQARDFYRVALFLLWGTPLDEPIDNDTEVKLRAALREIKEGDHV